MVENFIKQTLKKEFDQVNLGDINAIHGNTISVKIVMPCYCQANCPFCFNNQTISTQMHDWGEFEKNLIKSLTFIVKNINHRKISLDITGNEPTFNINHFKKFIELIYNFRKRYSDKIDKVVLTTNGFHLYECIPYLYPTIDIVNISLHHYNYSERRNIFKTKYIPSNEDLKSMIQKMNSGHMTVTSVAVIYNNVDIKRFVENFANFSKELGFKDSRIRFNFTSNNTMVRNQFYHEFTDNDQIVENAGLSTKYLDYDGYKVNLYLGVPDLIDYVIGVEFVIDDNGKLYLDYNKRFEITDSQIINDFDKNVYLIK